MTFTISTKPDPLAIAEMVITEIVNQVFCNITSLVNNAKIILLLLLILGYRLSIVKYLTLH